MCRENVSFVITTDIDSFKQGNAFIDSLGITICGFCFDFTGSYFGALAFIVVALIIAVLLIVAGYVRSEHVMPIADAEYEELTGKQAAE